MCPFAHPSRAGFRYCFNAGPHHLRSLCVARFPTPATLTSTYSGLGFHSERNPRVHSYLLPFGSNHIGCISAAGLPLVTQYACVECIYTGIHLCLHVCKYVWVYLCLYMYICIHECMYVGLVGIYVRCVFMRGERR